MANVMANVVLRSYGRNTATTNEPPQTWKGDKGEAVSHPKKIPGTRGTNANRMGGTRKKTITRGKTMNEATNGGRASNPAPSPDELLALIDAARHTARSRAHATTAEESAAALAADADAYSAVIRAVHALTAK